jgi:hypothetical protein
MKTISIEDVTHKRLTVILEEVMHGKRRNVTYDDIINELIDLYQESSWGHLGAASGGG